MKDSRNKTTPINVLPLEAEDAKSMLLSRLPDQLGWTVAEVLELLESLQHLPLAIAQAASYIREESVIVARCLELLRFQSVVRTRLL